MKTAVGFLFLAILGAALCLTCFSPVFYLLIALVLLPLIYGIALYRGRKRLVAAVLVLALFLVRFGAFSAQSRTLSRHNGDDVGLTVVITDTRAARHSRSSARYATIRTSDVAYLHAGQKVMVYTDVLYPEGTVLSARFTVSADEKPTATTSYHAAGFVAGITPLTAVSYKEGHGLWKTVGHWRRVLQRDLYEKSRHGPLLTAVLYGERLDLNDALIHDFQKAGVIHLLVVSGFHFTVLLYGLIRFLRLLGLPRWTRGLLAALFVIGLCLLCGLTVSVLRAAVFYVYADLYRLLHRLESRVFCLCGALAVLLFFNPYCLFSISLQLSFAATFGLLVGYPFIVRVAPLLWVPLGRHPKLIKAVALPLSAWLFTLPLVWWHFGCFSTVSIPVNLILSPLMSLLLPLTALALLSGQLSHAVGTVLLRVCDGLCDALTKITHFAAGLPFAYPSLKYEKAAAILLVAAYCLFYERTTCKCRRLLVQLKQRSKKG